MSPRLITQQFQKHAPLSMEANMRTTIEHKPITLCSTHGSPNPSRVASTVLARAAFALDNLPRTTLTPNSPLPDLLDNQHLATDQSPLISDGKRKRRHTESHAQTVPTKKTLQESSDAVAQGSSSTASDVLTAQCGEPQEGSVVFSWQLHAGKDSR